MGEILLGRVSLHAGGAKKSVDVGQVRGRRAQVAGRGAGGGEIGFERQPLAHEQFQNVQPRLGLVVVHSLAENQVELPAPDPESEVELAAEIVVSAESPEVSAD